MLSLNRDGLAQSGLAVATRDRARAQAAARRARRASSCGSTATHRRTGRRRRPGDEPALVGAQNYNFYTLEVVQRIGYDSFTPTSGVLIAKNKDQASPVGGPNSFNLSTG